jgi:hypothetical protein
MRDRSYEPQRLATILARGAIAATIFVLGAQYSLAAENGVGVYPLGLRGPLAGIVPAPGVYFQNDFFFYDGDAGASRPLPLNGNLVADVHAKMPVDIPTLLWSTPIPIAGGNLAFSGSLPIGGPSIDAGLGLTSPFLNSEYVRNAHDAITTVGDPFLVSSIGWHAGDLHWTGGVGLNVPIGDYREGALSNIAFHRWATDVFGAATWLNPKTGIDLSAAVGVTFNGKNSATDYNTGTEFHLEYAATQNLPNGFSFGLVGYYYDQISGDSGTGAKLGAFEGRVTALGGSLGYMFKVDGRDVITRLKIYREFDVTNRLEGTSGYFTVSMPLYVYAPPGRPVK